MWLALTQVTLSALMVCTLQLTCWLAWQALLMFNQSPLKRIQLKPPQHSVSVQVTFMPGTVYLPFQFSRLQICEGPEILFYQQANILSSYCFVGASKRHEMPGTETKKFITRGIARILSIILRHDDLLRPSPHKLCQKPESEEPKTLITGGRPVGSFIQREKLFLSFKAVPTQKSLKR